MKHYAKLGLKDRMSVCSTPTNQVTAPLTSNPWMVDCPKCKTLSMPLAARLKPKAPAKARADGLPRADGAAMAQAKVALGVKRTQEAKPRPAPEQMEGQMSIDDVLGGSDA